MKASDILGGAYEFERVLSKQASAPQYYSLVELFNHMLGLQLREIPTSFTCNQ